LSQKRSAIHENVKSTCPASVNEAVLSSVLVISVGYVRIFGDCGDTICLLLGEKKMRECDILGSSIVGVELSVEHVLFDDCLFRYDNFRPEAGS
jgi:hypothetical protein